MMGKIFNSSPGSSDTPVTEQSNIFIQDLDNIQPNPHFGDFLRNVPIMSQFTRAEADIIGAFLQPRTFKSGQDIITQGEVGDGMYFLKEGSAKIVKITTQGKKTKENEIDMVSQYDYFGEACLSSSAPRLASIIATCDCTALYLSRSDFLRLFQNPQTNELSLTFVKRGGNTSPEATTSGGATTNVPETVEKNLQKNSEPRRPARPVTAKDPKVEKLLTQTLKEHQLFKGASDEHKARAIAQMWKMQLPKDEVVIKQGELGDNFYVLESGRVSIYISSADGKSVRKHMTMKKAGDYFGDLALLYNTPRNATIKTKEKTTLWVLDRLTLRGVMRNMTQERLDSYIQFVSSIPLFQPLSNTERTQIAESLESRSYRMGDCIVKEGQHGDTMYVILNGSVEVSKIINGNHVVLTTLTSGHFFGERSLLENEPRTATVTCLGHVDVASLDQYAFVALLGPLIPTLKSHLEQIKNRDQQIKDADEDENNYNNNNNNNGSMTDNDYDELSHEQNTPETGNSRLYQQDEEDGMPAPLFSSAGGGGVTISSTIDSSVPDHRRGSLSTGSGLGQSLTRRRPSNFNNQTMKRSELQALLNARYAMRANCNPDLAREAFTVLRLVTITESGYIELVRHSTNKQNFFLETILRSRVGSDVRLQANVMTNKNVLLEVDSPFVVHLYATYKTERKLMLLLEPCLGGDLFTFLREKIRFDEKSTRFVASLVLLGLEDIHRQGYIYRDLKPENILFTGEGYIKMHNMSFAKKLLPNQRTFTSCGTPEYLSPEMILGSGHNQGVDFWSLGVLIYEMISGFPPFYRPDESADYTTRLFRRIGICDYKPTRYMTPAVWDLIQRLLTPLNQRIGGGIYCPEQNPFITLRQHEWFQLDWNALRKQEVRAPIIPNPENSRLDLSEISSRYKNADLEPVPPGVDPTWDNEF